MSKPIYETKDFAVTVEDIGGTDIPPSRQKAYFVRHKEHGVAHEVTNLLGQALMICVALQKATDVVVADPENPELPQDAPRHMGGGFSGLN